MDANILTPKDVAAILGLDPSTVRRYWKRLGGVSFGRTYRIRRDVLDAYLAGGGHAIQAQAGREMDRPDSQGRDQGVVGTVRYEDASQGLGGRKKEGSLGSSSNGLW